ncbi:MAG: AMP-binding protein [Bacteroidales bacterium]|nr:AMP-binding protein [Bacteroidales bacterium]
MNTYLDSLETSFAEHWHDVALSNYGGEELTYGRVAAHVAALHLLFEGLGVREGEHVAVCGAPSARRSVALLAVITYGATVVNCAHGHCPEGCGIMLADETCFAVMETEVKAMRCVLALDDFSLLHAADPVVAQACRGLEERFNALYSGGLTPATLRFRRAAGTVAAIVSPDGLVVSYNTLCHSITAADASLGLTAGDSLLALLPPWSTDTVVNELLLPLRAGCQVHYVRTGIDVVEALAEVRPTVVDSLAVKQVESRLRKPVLSLWGRKHRQTQVAEALGGRVSNVI